MKPITEDIIESLAIENLQSLGWVYAYGLDRCTHTPSGFTPPQVDERRIESPNKKIKSMIFSYLDKNDEISQIDLPYFDKYVKIRKFELHYFNNSSGRFLAQLLEMFFPKLMSLELSIKILY
jgi:hypothetical protein